MTKRKFDHDEIAKLILERNYLAHEIAKIVGCSVATVQRVGRERKISPGQGIKHYWKFNKSSPELCYLIGIYLTDGHITKNYQTGNPSSLIVTNTVYQICEKARLCAIKIGVNSTITGPYQPSTNLGNKVQYRTNCYSKMFAEFLTEESSNKNRIPQFILDAPRFHQVEFLSGAIDGDGSVTRYGTIRLRNVSMWLSDVPKILENLSVRTTGFKPSEKLLTDKVYYVVTIKRKDFVLLEPKCAHPVKQHRILYPEKRKNYTPHKKVVVVCPTCGMKRKSKNAKQCEQCYRNSKQFRKHLKSIAKKGNRAANIARWGTSHLNNHKA